MSTARKILSNTVAQFISKLMVAILGILVVKIVTGYLGREDFGAYTYIYEYLAFFGIAADLGLFTIAVKEMSEDEDRMPEIIGNVLSLRTILVTVSMLIAVIGAFLVPGVGNKLVPFGIAIASITVYLTIINGTITSVLQTKLKMEISSVIAIVGKLITLGAMAYIVFGNFSTSKEGGFLLLIAAGVFGALVSLLATNHYVRKITPISYRFDPKLWKKLVVQSAPYGLALILNTVYFRIDSILIFHMRGSQELGLYGVAMKMLEQFSILPLYFMNSVLPTLTRTIKEAAATTATATAKAAAATATATATAAKSAAHLATEKYKKVISLSFDFLAAMSAPLVVGGFVLAYPIVFVVSTPEFLSDLPNNFYGSDIAFQILIFALLFQFLNVLFAFILIATNKQYKLLYINASCAILNIVLNIIVIPKYGFRGAAATSVLSEAFILIATYLTAKKYLKFSLNLKNLSKIIFSALTMGVGINFLITPTYNLVQNWNILLLIPIGALIYLAMLFATKTVSKEMLQLIRKTS